MMQCSRRKLAQAFVSLLNRYPRSDVMGLLASELVRQGRARELDLLAVDIVRHLYAMRRELVAEVHSAHPLPGQLLKELKHLLRSATGAYAVEVTGVLDPDLVGGVLIKTAEWELDGTIRRALRRLA